MTIRYVYIHFIRNEREHLNPDKKLTNDDDDDDNRRAADGIYICIHTICITEYNESGDGNTVWHIQVNIIRD